MVSARGNVSMHSHRALARRGYRAAVRCNRRFAKYRDDSAHVGDKCRSRNYPADRIFIDLRARANVTIVA